MSENRSTKSVFLIGIMMLSLFVPLLSSPVSADETSNEHELEAELGVIIGDLADFNIADGREYLLIDEATPVVSAYGFMKQAWIDAGRPGVDDMKYEPLTNSRTSGRSCCLSSIPNFARQFVQT